MILLSVLRQSNLQEDYAHSVLIALLRGAAALEVAAAHLRAAVYPSYATLANPPHWFTAFAFLTGFAHQAVVIFFLISGWLVGGSLLNKARREHAIRDYAIDRITRLWVVLVPMLVVVLLISISTGKVDPGVPSYAFDNAFSVVSFLGNLTGLQTIFVPEFGGNFPLWSLANETWYYVMFPILVLVVTAKSMTAKLLSLTAISAIATWLNGDLLLYFAIWVMGAACSRLRIDANAKLRWLFFGGFATTSVYFRIEGRNFGLDVASFAQDCIFSAAFLLCLATMQYKLPAQSTGWDAAARCGKFLASFSFTLYVLHVPLIVLILHFSEYLSEHRLSASSISHLGAYGAIFLAVVVACYLFHLPFEANTHRLRTHLKTMVQSQGKSSVVT